MEAQKHFTEFIKALNGMQLKDKDLFLQYALIKNAEKVIADRVKELGGIIKEEMVLNGEQKRMFEYGNFTLVPKVVWEYSEAVENLKKTQKVELTKLQANEQGNGVAVAKPADYVLFT